MKNKTKVKFLTVIWGERYIEEFARVSLPSYLAPENLPYMAERTDLGVLIMTTKDSVSKLQENAVFKKLEALCPVEFIFIDDLITNGVYGVVLTLAYARGIRSCGDEQTDTNFVFMNSDFVLANGSLKTLTHEIEAGKPCVMASSLRGSAEALMPALLDAVDHDQMHLAMEPRDMVALTLKDLHPTVIAKTITQDFLSSSTYNQIYWSVDNDTLLGRCHLIFMLMIKPERPLPPVNSYCDYGLVPELVPSGEVSAIEDSDHFFMLETQPAKQELDFLRCGIKTPREIAMELSEWSTKEHRACAGFDFVFHSGEIPEMISSVKAEAATFVSQLHEKMRKTIKDHAYHFYWVSGVEAWSYLRGEGDVYNKKEVKADEYPAEFYPSATYAKYLELTSQAEPEDQSDFSRYAPRRIGLSVFQIGASFLSRKTVYEILVRVGRRWKGVYPNVAMWSSLWSDAKLALDWASKKKDGGAGAGLIICDPDSPFPTAFNKVGEYEVLHPKDFKKSTRSQVGKYSRIFIHARRKDIRNVPRLFEYASGVASPDAEIAISIEHPDNETDSSNFSYELAQYVDSVLPASWLDFDIAAKFTGGRIKRQLRLLERTFISRIVPNRLRHIPVAVLAILLLPLVSALTLLNNIQLRQPTRTCPEFCSSALIILRARNRK